MSGNDDGSFGGEKRDDGFHRFRREREKIGRKQYIYEK